MSEPQLLVLFHPLLPIHISIVNDLEKEKEIKGRIGKKIQYHRDASGANIYGISIVSSYNFFAA